MENKIEISTKQAEYIVYMHITPNNKKYIGITSCKKPEDRWRKGKGYYRNIHFYNAIQKYGWDNIEHKILYENLSKEEAQGKEIELIKRYKTNKTKYGYNNTKGGENIFIGKENRKSRPIKQYDLQGNFIKEYESANMCANELGIDRRKITSCCLGINRTYHKFFFIYADEKFVYREKMTGKHDGHKRLGKKVIMDNKFIFNSTREAADKINGNYTHIINCCKGKRKTHKGHIFKYAEEVV